MAKSKKNAVNLYASYDAKVAAKDYVGAARELGRIQGTADLKMHAGIDAARLLETQKKRYDAVSWSKWFRTPVDSAACLAAYLDGYRVAIGV